MFPGQRVVAHVAHYLATDASHGVAAVIILDEGFVAADTLPQHGLGHGQLQLGPGSHLGLFLVFITGKRNMIFLATQSASLCSAIRILNM